MYATPDQRVAGLPAGCPGPFCDGRRQRGVGGSFHRKNRTGFYLGSHFGDLEG